MLTLYHGKTSVCSAKVRIGLAEKSLPWNGKIIDLAKGEQNDPWYLELNPKGVVPTLVHGDVRVVESSVILEYVDTLDARMPLMPADPARAVRARVWLASCVDIHAAINTLTYASSKRDKILASKSPDEIERMLARISHPANASKRRDVLEKGLASDHVASAFFTLHLLFTTMRGALAQSPWLAAQGYSIADAALIAYIDRLDRLGLANLWAEPAPRVTGWLTASRARPSYDSAIGRYAGAWSEARDQSLAAGSWQKVGPLWENYLSARG